MSYIRPFIKKVEIFEFLSATQSGLYYNGCSKLPYPASTIKQQKRVEALSEAFLNRAFFKNI